LRAPLVLAVLASAATPLAGCGEGSSSSASSGSSSTSSSGAAPAGSTAKAAASHAVISGSPGAPGGGSGSRVDAVAVVSGTPVTKASYEHWLASEKDGGVTDSPGHHALAFLITSDWVLHEALARHISVSQAEVKQRFQQLVKQGGFAKPGALKSYLAKSGETEADLLRRIRVELLQSRIAAQVSAGKSSSQRKAALATFERTFRGYWKPLTSCDAGYVMEDCSQYKGGEENLAPTRSSPRSSAQARSGSSTRSHSVASGSSGKSNTSAASNATGEVYPSSNSISLTSPAFERNGEIPAQYTCAGSDVSPPLQWSNLPAKTAALVLFVIDDSATGPASGIRWVVGDINPSSKGVAAGATPEGGIVGSDTQGHAGYGGICPQPGKTSTVEFVLYSLSKRIPLTPGFQPSVAEGEYGRAKLLNSSAVTYAVYTRP
jgi:phosphatidylethanolamine-binding protein (PEBP) family uncharacterized protein